MFDVCSTIKNISVPIQYLCCRDPMLSSGCKISMPFSASLNGCQLHCLCFELLRCIYSSFLSKHPTTRPFVMKPHHYLHHWKTLKYCYIYMKTWLEETRHSNNSNLWYRKQIITGLIPIPSTGRTRSKRGSGMWAEEISQENVSVFQVWGKRTQTPSC